MIRTNSGVARELEPGFTGAGVVGGPGGPVHVGVLRVAAGHEIPRHPAVGDQAFVVVSGTGRVSGGDGVWRPIRAGQAALWSDGEEHHTRADTDLTAVVVEGANLPLHPRAVEVDGDGYR